MSILATPGSESKKQETRDAQKVLRLLAKKLRVLGFERTKPTFFTRSAQHVIEFVHVHKYTFGPHFRIHFGVRVRSDDSPAAHLNGPDSNGIAAPETPGDRRYKFSFTTSGESREDCVEAMFHCVSEEGICWFASLADPDVLLAQNSPLSPAAKRALEKEGEDAGHAQVSEATRRALNVELN
jgi:hypothetical protein